MRCFGAKADKIEALLAVEAVLVLKRVVSSFGPTAVAFSARAKYGFNWTDVQVRPDLCIGGLVKINGIFQNSLLLRKKIWPSLRNFFRYATLSFVSN